MKKYTYVVKSDYDKEFSVGNNHSWKGYSVKNESPHLPILGYLTKKKTELSLVDESVMAYIKPKRSSWFYKIKGYLVCQNETGEEFLVEVIKLRFLMLILLWSVLIGIGVWGWNLQSNRLNLDSNAIAYQMPNALKNEKPESIMIPGYEELKMAPGNELSISLLNPDGNPCYFKYRLILSETEEILYESDLIKPGFAIVPVKLNRALEEGTYNLLIQVQTFSLENPEQPMNSGTVEAVLTVK